MEGASHCHLLVMESGVGPKSLVPAATRCCPASLQGPMAVAERSTRGAAPLCRGAGRASLCAGGLVAFHLEFGGSDRSTWSTELTQLFSEFSSAYFYSLVYPLVKHTKNMENPHF